MFFDDIISIHKAMTGNIFYKGNLLVIWDYIFEKAIWDYSDEKNLLNYLIYVFIRRSYIKDWRNICFMMPL